MARSDLVGLGEEGNCRGYYLCEKNWALPKWRIAWTEFKGGAGTRRSRRPGGGPREKKSCGNSVVSLGKKQKKHGDI